MKTMVKTKGEPSNEVPRASNCSQSGGCGTTSMDSAYFKQVHKQTPTRLWINNPTGEELKKSIEAGAISCTTNPSYCSRLLKDEPNFIYQIIDSVIRNYDDNNQAAEAVVYQATVRVIEHFLPIYEKSGGKGGFVTIQDDPRRDEDPDAVINAAMKYRKIGPNFMMKVPVIEAGCNSIERIISENIPICATEVFAISQAIHICELYETASKKSGCRPPFFVTHIAGIFDEYLTGVARKEGINIPIEIIEQAGCAISREEYKLIKERGYHTILLGGGARGTRHFTELVGGDIHVTINWSTAEEIINSNTPVLLRIDNDAPQEVVKKLTENFMDFKKAIDTDGLQVEEFGSFGPVQFFRNKFLEGYNHLIREIESLRT